MKIRKLTKPALIASILLLALPALAEDSGKTEACSPWQVRDTIYKDALASDNPSSLFKKNHLLSSAINYHTAAYMNALAKINTGDNTGYGELSNILVQKLGLDYDLGTNIVMDIKSKCTPKK